MIKSVSRRVLPKCLSNFSFQMERLVKEELERWDSDSSISKSEKNEKNDNHDDKDDKNKKASPENNSISDAAQSNRKSGDKDRVESDRSVTSGRDSQSGNDEISSSSSSDNGAGNEAESENDADSSNRPTSRLSSRGSGESLIQ